MFASLEYFLSQYPATISALAATATWAAVVVALYIPYISRRPQIRAIVDISRCFSPELIKTSEVEERAIEPEEGSLVLTLTIENRGQTSVVFPYYSLCKWTVPTGAIAAQYNPETDFRSSPIELAPGRSVSILLANQYEFLGQVFSELARNARMGRWAAKFPGLVISSENGLRFRARISRELKKEISRQTKTYEKNIR